MGQNNDSIYPPSGPNVNNVSPPLTQGASYMPTFYYNYPGQGGSFGQSDDQGLFSASGVSYAPENTSPLYYPHGYVPYTTGFYDSAYSVDGSESYSYSNAPMMGSNIPGPNAGTALSDKAQALPYNPMIHNPRANLTEPNPPPNAFNTRDHGFQPPNLVRGYNRAPEFSSLASRKPSSFMQYGPKNHYHSNDRTGNNYGNYKQRGFARNNNAAAGGSMEMARGPRSERKNPPKKEEEDKEKQLWNTFQRDAYNLPDFKIEYKDAKFFVIKSFSEDDVQRSLKYNVWSSTPNGNNKLDATFRAEEDKAGETGKRCPIFLFFSVNTSGQFVGVAEMIGKVDFTKNMDFWQQTKWSGFLPLKWHIVKDVPNKDLRHIILENNEHKPVTQSRDTQEIGLKQGLEMLMIFKNYKEEASLLDDYDFYEKRGKEMKANRDAKAASRHEFGDETELVSLTNRLSLDS